MHTPSALIQFLNLWTKGEGVCLGRVACNTSIISLNRITDKVIPSGIQKKLWKFHSPLTTVITSIQEVVEL